MDVREHMPATESAHRPLILVLGLLGLLAWLLALVGRSPLLWPLGLVMLGACVRLSAGARAEQEETAERAPEPTTPLPAYVPRLPIVEQPAVPDMDAPASDDVRALLRTLQATSGDAVSVHLWLRDACSQSLRLLAAVGSLRPDSVPLPLDDEPVGLALAQRAPAVRAVASVRLGGEPSTLWRFAAPLVPADTGLAVSLDLLSAEEPQLPAFAEAVRAVDAPLSAATLLRLAEEAAADARALADALDELACARDRRSLLENALVAAISLAHGSAGSLMLADARRRCLRVAASRGARPGLDGTEKPEGEGIAGWVAATRCPLLVEDLPHRSEPARPAAGRSSMSVPLLDGDTLLGVLNVGCAHYPALPMAPRVDALTVFARHLALELRRFPA